MRLGCQSAASHQAQVQTPMLRRVTTPQRFCSAVSKPHKKHDARMCRVTERRWRISAGQSQDSSMALVDKTAEAAEDAISQLTSERQLRQAATSVLEAVEEVVTPEHLAQKRLQRKQRKAREQTIYKLSAIAASTAVIALAVAAVHYRFTWHMKQGHDFPTAEALATFCLTIGGIVGMEMWARFAHKALWHDFQPGWALHKSHHEPRVGPFEDNDVFAICNAVPAMGLCLYGLLTPTLTGGLCFGAGLGITLFGISYMFVHDGLVHKRFPVGPIAEVPYLKRVAIAHQLHHSEKYKGVPWGLFLGPQELEAVGAKEHLDMLCERQ